MEVISMEILKMKFGITKWKPTSEQSAEKATFVTI